MVSASVSFIGRFPCREETSIAPRPLSDPCPDDPANPVRMAMRAAAVCYRRTSDGVEFLLVRTRSRTGWTFPKGHLERGESPREAAVREAKEEGAVAGRIEAAPFVRYRQAVWIGPGMQSEVCVEAYLMEVDTVGGGRSAERATAWLAPADAVRKLAEGRPTAYAREHRRVIREAMARLQPLEADT